MSKARGILLLACEWYIEQKVFFLFVGGASCLGNQLTEVGCDRAGVLELLGEPRRVPGLCGLSGVAWTDSFPVPVPESFGWWAGLTSGGLDTMHFQNKTN